MTAAEARHPTASAAEGLDQLAINTIRTLAIDAVQKADSGHAGAPMGLAPVAYTLWTRFLRYDPKNPAWPDRDRFVLSCGHASMLLYALIHLAGVERVDRHGKKLGKPAVSLDDIKAFRELDSVCAGHPEYGLTTGVETTTGPLGQGAANSVGMAMAERWMEQRFNRPGLAVFGHRVWTMCSDGDLMEGVASEAASIAGHLKLSNLCWIYDDNTVTIDGHTDIAFTEDVAKRFQAYGWKTFEVEDANDCEAFARVVDRVLEVDDRPTLILVHSVIGYGSPHKQGTSKIHSDPLGEEEVRLTKRAYGWPEDAQFLVPDGVTGRFDESLGARGAKAHEDWEALFRRYAEAEPELAAELKALLSGEPPKGWDKAIPVFDPDPKGMASREASGKVLNAIAPNYPWLMGGSADLAGSNKTTIENDTDLQPQSYGGRNIHYGVREHAMGSISNGLALSGLRPYTGTFLIFSDYMRPPTRLAALMDAPVVFVFTHDSIGLGQDGPTHQPIEQLAALRAIPNLIVLRPCDANETAEAWRTVLAQTTQPACLSFSRQALPTMDRSRYGSAKGVAKGGYVLADAKDGDPEVILMGSGSEVHLCVEAYETLAAEGVKARVVSMPSWDLFEAQDEAYRASVLPPKVTARVAVEAAAALGWDRYAGPTGEVIAMRSFGMSAPAKDLLKYFGFTADKVLEAARRQLGRARSGDGMTNPLKRLAQAGQSIWLDYMHRKLMESGELKRLIEEDAVTGMTSNPSIFEKAIGEGGDYDDRLKAALDAGVREPMDIYERLAIKDIQDAADQLKPVWDRTHGVDGYISLEVSPYLAMDTDKTVHEAERLWKAVDRRNLMIKVPGTGAGAPAIQQLIGQGINVNVTLLFGLDAYLAVAEAHVAGLEHFKAHGGDVSKVHGVASFFVSRIDTQIDKKIDERVKAGDAKSDELKALRGKVAIANAKIAYQRYIDMIGTARWKALSEAGASPQRLLWASTGTKDPAYSDVLYVESLIGPDTVNTMPTKTLEAFKDHGQVNPTLAEDVDAASDVLLAQAHLGLDLDGVTKQLVTDGVKSFAESFDTLLGAVKSKRDEMMGEKA